MASIKLNSSGGGSVSLSAASTSTDVTVKFPSGNSSVGQALVAGNTSGELDWEDVPTDSSKVVFHGYLTPDQGAASYAIDGTGYNIQNTWETLPFDYSYAGSQSEAAITPIDTHNAYDSTNHYYVVPTNGYYHLRLSLTVFANPIHQYDRRTVAPVISIFDSTNTLKQRFVGVKSIDTTGLVAGNSTYDDVEVSVNYELNANDRIYFEISGINLEDQTNYDLIVTHYISTEEMANTYANVERLRGV